MSTSESGSFTHKVQIHKWSEEQTAAAAERFGVDPDDLTEEQLASLGQDPVERIHIDHTEGTLTHTDREGRVTVRSLNEEH